MCAANPRYFADPSGRPVYLTGSHTWQSLQDGSANSPANVDEIWSGFFSRLAEALIH